MPAKRRKPRKPKPIKIGTRFLSTGLPPYYARRLRDWLNRYLEWIEAREEK